MKCDWLYECETLATWAAVDMGMTVIEDWGAEYEIRTGAFFCDEHKALSEANGLKDKDQMLYFPLKEAQ